MKTQALLALLAASICSVAAVPSPQDAANRKAGLRLIKTSPKGAPKWISEEEKIVQYAAHEIGFVDITDITVSTMPLSLTPFPACSRE